MNKWSMMQKSLRTLILEIALRLRYRKVAPSGIYSPKYSSFLVHEMKGALSSF